MNDPRNRLIGEVLRVARGLLPKVILMENVSALQKYTRFRQFASELTFLGYQLRYDVLDVADFGVPQRRKRLVTILLSTVYFCPQAAPSSIMSRSCALS